MKRLYANILLFWVFIPFSFSQISFSDNTSLLGGLSTYGGGPVGIVDLNNDGYDDIVLLNYASDIIVVYQHPDSLTYPYTNTGMFIQSWAVCAGDVDNDGWSELFAGGYNNGILLLRPDVGNPGMFNDEYLDAPNQTFVQGSNMADINNDGFLDIFICHDNGPSRIIGNDGTGDFFFTDTDWIDLELYPTAEENSGNYGSVWSDFDSDGDLDLYIAKCRQGVNSPSDPRRINQLWVNDGNNNYSELGAEYNLNNGAQSWTADFADIDNDGDFDCFITNHDVLSQLLENVGNGRFEDITPASGIEVGGLAIQGIMEDFDNDGYVDILVSGSFDQLFMNNGDKTFTEIEAGLSGDMHSFAIGDLNTDGFIDIFGSYGDGFNTPSNVDEDILWLNDGNDNHYLNVNLEGVISNRMAVGARVEIFGPWGKQIREVRAGESYGIFNSFTRHFGLGDSEQVDLVVVKWPSGRVNVVENPGVDTSITIVESDCSYTAPDISFDGPAVLCEGESIELTVSGGANPIWSTGEMSNSITVTESGTFYCYLEDGNGCYAITDAVQIFFESDFDVELIVDGATEICEGGVVTLTAETDYPVTWSTGDTTQTIEITASGTYFATAEGLCSLVQTPSVDVAVYQVDLPTNLLGDTLGNPGVAELLATGDSLLWYENPTGGMPIGSGSLFVTDILEETTTFYVENVLSVPQGPLFLGPEAHNGTSLFNGDSYNGGLYFNAERAFRLISLKAFTDTPGMRRIELRNANNDSLITFADVDIQDVASDTVFELNFDIAPGNYYITTDESVNINTLGYESPRFYRSNLGISYPYEVQEVVSIYGSSASESFYYYFYDWEIESALDCYSERLPVTVFFDSTLQTNSLLDKSDLRLFPNPVKNQLNIDLRERRAIDWKIWDATGRLALARQSGVNQVGNTEQLSINVGSLHSGVYVIEIQTEEGTWRGKFIK